MEEFASTTAKRESAEPLNVERASAEIPTSDHHAATPLAVQLSEGASLAYKIMLESAQVACVQKVEEVQKQFDEWVVNNFLPLPEVQMHIKGRQSHVEVIDGLAWLVFDD